MRRQKSSKEGGSDPAMNQTTTPKRPRAEFNAIRGQPMTRCRSEESRDLASLTIHDKSNGGWGAVERFNDARGAPFLACGWACARVCLFVNWEVFKFVCKRVYRLFLLVLIYIWYTWPQRIALLVYIFSAIFTSSKTRISDGQTGHTVIRLYGHTVIRSYITDIKMDGRRMGNNAR